MSHDFVWKQEILKVCCICGRIGGKSAKSCFRGKNKKRWIGKHGNGKYMTYISFIHVFESYGRVSPSQNC